MAIRRIHALYLVIGSAAIFAVGGWLASSQILSPADVAARTAPPTPSPILVPVEKRVLSSKIVTRGTGRFGRPQPLTIAPSTLKPDAGLIGRLPVINTQIKEGDVVLSASGRPLLILQGEIPAYRDLVPGLIGDDVRQLEAGLERLGHSPGPVDGIFDQQTSAAVSRWYAALGWKPFGPTLKQQDKVRTLEQAMGDARKRLLAAEADVTAASLAVEFAHTRAERDKKAAASELAARRVDLSKLRVSHPEGAAIPVDTVRATVEHQNKSAAAELTAQIFNRNLIVLDPRQPESARAAADAKLALARATAHKTRLEGEIAVKAAEQEIGLSAEQLKQAEAAVASAQAAVNLAGLEGAIAVQSAMDALAVARLEAKLAAAQVDSLATDLKSAKKKLAVQVPVDEIVFMPALPVRVKEVTAKVGDPARGTVMSITDNQLAIDASLTLETAPLVEVGMPVTIDEQALGIKASGIVKHIATTPGTHGVDGYHIYFEVGVSETSTRLEGVSLRLTIPVKSTGGAVTVVPISAVSLSADGMSRVQVNTNGKLEYIPVEPGLSADGYVAVTSGSRALSPGQLVVVGYQNPEQRTSP